MLTKVLFNSTSQLYQTNIFHSSCKLIVTPSPIIADQLRKEFEKRKLAVEICTIADFYQRWQKAMGGERLELESKSGLWFIFNRIWYNCGGPKDFKIFEIAFHLFSECRSFTHDTEVFARILELELNLDLKTKNGLLQLFSLPDLNDEHAFLRNILNSELTPNEKIFQDYPSVSWIGFKQLSPLQVDFFNTTKMYMNHFIFLYEELNQDATSLDWPTWLKEDQVLRLDHQSITVKAKNNSSVGPHKIVFFDSIERIRKSMQEYNSDDVFIFLGQNVEGPRWEIEQFFTSFQINGQLEMWQRLLHLERNEVTSLLFNHTQYSPAELISYYQDKIKQALEYKKYLMPLIKLWLQIIASVQLRIDILRGWDVIDLFDVFVMFQQLEWDLPRIFWHKFDSSNIRNENWEEYFPNDSIRTQILLVNDNSFETSLHVKERFRSETLQVFALLGPVYTTEWRKKYQLSKIDDFLRMENSVIWLSKHAVETSIFWREIEKKFHSNIQSQSNIDSSDIHTKDQNNIETEKNISLFPAMLKAPISHKNFYSTTAWNTFNDCPRKYYSEYIESWKIPRNIDIGLTEAMKGEWMHELLRCCAFLPMDKIPDEVSKVFAKYNYSEEEDREAYFEILSGVKNSLLQLKEMLFLETEDTLLWEEDLYNESLKYKARADYIALNKKNKKFIVLDFKKSSNGIPSKKSISEGIEIQVISYLCMILQKYNIKIEEWNWSVGYWCITDPSKSLIFNYQVNVTERENNSDLLMVKELIEQFPLKWQEGIQHIEQEKLFLPQPKDAKVCSYCIISKMCPKEQVL